MLNLSFCRTATFGVIIQLISFAVTTPLWLFLHLLTSPVAQSDASLSSLLISPADLNVIPLNIALTFLFPSLLMGFPSPQQTTPEFHQFFIALWQPFPIFTTIFQYLFRPAINYRLAEEAEYRKDQGIKSEPESVAYLNSSKNVYLFALIICTATHVFSIYSLFLNNNFAQVFIPFSISHPGQPVPNLIVGVINFLQLDVYIGLTAFLTWATYLYLSARSAVKAAGTNWGLGVRVALWAVLAGPMGIVLVLLGARDEILIQGREVEGKKDN